MSEVFDRTLIDPTPTDLAVALTEAVAANAREMKVIRWPPADLNAFLKRLASAPEGLYGWHGGAKPRYFGGRAQIIAAWWTDVPGRKHVRVLGGDGGDLCRLLGIDAHGKRTPPALSTAELLYRDRVGRVQRAGGAPALAAVCDCGAAGSLQALGWTGERCGPCHDQLLDGHAPQKPLLVRRLIDGFPSISFHPNARSLVFAMGNIRRYYMGSGTADSVPLPSGFGSCRDAAFTPDGTRLVLIDDGRQGDTEFAFARWEVGAPTAARWTLPRDPQLAPRYGLAPDRETIAVAFPRTARGEGHLVACSTRGGRSLWTAPSQGPANIRFSPDGARLVVTDRFRPTRIFDAQTGEMLSEFEQAAGVRALTFSPDGEFLYGFDGDRGGSGFVLDLTGRIVRDFDRSGDSFGLVTFDPSGRVFVAAATERLAFWDLDAGDRRCELRSGEGIVPSAIAWSPDGRWLVTGGRGGIRFWPWPGVFDAARAAP